VTLNATVSAVGSTVNAGSVTFQIKTTGATPSNVGSAVTDTSVVDGAASVVYTIPAAALPGVYTIVATYNPSANFIGSSDSSAKFSLLYRFDGFLQPINDTAHQQVCGSVCPISIFKAGSTVPVKFDLKRADGTLVSAVALPTFVGPVKGGPTTDPIDESVYTDPPTAGSTFSNNGGHYQYNWSTKGLQAGFYYRIGAMLDDGTTQYVYIGLK
jgi:hypothetical protein